MGLKGKKVVIVGGSSGIGLSLAKKVSEKDGDVIIASRTAEEKREKLVKIDSLRRCKFFNLDITSEYEIQRFLEHADTVDHLVFTIKSKITTGRFEKLGTREVRKSFETKFWGQYNFVKFSFGKINSGGSIILTSGSLGLRPILGYSTMSMICGAVDSLCKTLALEFAPIRVNAVSPGFLTLKEMEDKIPLGLGSYSQIANAYLFLLEDSYTTGTVITSDGGALLI